MSSRQLAQKNRKPELKPLYIIGVLADTHIPDRVNELHPKILPSLRAAGVTQIFHAGDICSSSVLRKLEEIAPVTAVRGNRDWFVPKIPLVAEIELGRIHIALMHGHGGMARYLFDKVRFMIDGYKLNRYMRLLTRAVPTAQVVIFGHTHFPEMVWLPDKLLFNPGSSSFGSKKNSMPTIGYLRIYENGKVKPNIQYLKGYEVSERRWVKKLRG